MRRLSIRNSLGIHMGFVFLDLSGDTPCKQIDPLLFDIFWSCSN